MNGGRIDFQIGYSIDKTGLQQIQTELGRISATAKSAGESISPGLKTAQQEASKLSTLLSAATNMESGSLNVSKFNQYLVQSNSSLGVMKSNLSQAGLTGEAAFARLNTQLMTANTTITQTQSFLTRMINTFVNSAMYSVAYSMFNKITQSIAEAIHYVEDLDTALNRIRIVTGDSADKMDKFAISANKTAQSLATSTKAYAEAALIFYEQGLNDQEVEVRTNVTMKAANVTGQDAEEVSENLTAVWNGFNVATEDSEKVIDQLAAVAANSASNLEELSTAMSKVASAASTAGITSEQLTATIATIEEVTRQAPESIGTALKTIYARIGDLQVDGVDEFGTKLGDVSSQMAEMGVNILDETGSMRDMGEIIEEVGEKWQGWTRNQKQAAAVAMAGKRQYNNLFALFENWDKYNDNLDVASNSLGTLQEQQNTFLESIEGKKEKLGASVENIYGDLVSDEALGGFYDTANNIAQVFERMLSPLGEAGKSFTSWGLILTLIAKLFSGKISTGLASVVTGSTKTAEQERNRVQLLEQIKQSQNYINKLNQQDLLMSSKIVATQQATVVGNEAIGQLKLKMLQVQSSLTTEEQQDLNAHIIKIGKLTEEKVLLENELGLLAKASDLRLQEENALQNTFTNKQIINALSEGDLKLAQELNQVRLQTIQDEQTLLLTKMQKNELSLNDVFHLQQLGILSKEEYQTTKAIYGNDLNSKEAKEHILKLVQRTVNAAKGLNDKITENVNKEHELEEAANGFNMKLKEASQLSNFKGFFQGGIQGITSATMALTSFSSLVQTISNPDLSTWEKFTQTMMSLTMLIPSLTSAYTGFKSAKEALNLESAREIVFQAQINAKNQQGIITEGAEVAMDKAETISTAEKNIETGKEAVLEDLVQGKKKAGIAQTLAMIAVMKLYTAAQKASNAEEKVGILWCTAANIAKKLENSSRFTSITAKVTETLVTWGLVGAETAAVSIGLVFVALMVALVAAIAVVTTVIYRLIKAWNADADAAKEAAETARAAKTEYENMKTAYDNLKQSLEDYKSAKNGLDELTKGTQEWKSAVLELNQQVIDLMNTYEGLSQYVTNEDGVLTISDEGMDTMLEEQQKAVNSAATTSNRTQVDANRAQMRSDITNTRREVEGNLLGAAVETSILGPAGMLFGGIKNFSDAIEDSKTATMELNESIKANTEANTLLLEENARIHLEEIDEDFSSANAEDQQALAAMYAKAEDTIYQLTSSIYEDKGALGGGKTDKSIQQEYAELMGYEWVSNEGDNMGKYVNTEGETVDISDTVARKALAQEESQTIADQRIEGFKQTLAKVNKTSKDQGMTIIEKDETGKEIQTNLLADFAGGKKDADLSKMSMENLEQLETNLDKFEDSFLGIKGTEFLTDPNGFLQEMGLTFQDIQNMGYQTVDQFYAAMQNSVQNYRDELTQLEEGMYGSVETAYSKLDLGEMSLSQQSQIANDLKEAFSKGGQEALDSLVTIYNEAGEQADELSNVLANVDWSNTSLEDLNLLLEEQEINIDTSTKSWQKYIEIQKELAHQQELASVQINALKERLQDIQSLQETEKFEVIDEEQYQRLIQYNKKLEKMFVLTADGYQLIGDSQEAAELAQGNYRGMADMVEENLADYEAISTERMSNWMSGMKADGSKALSNQGFGTVMGWIADANSADTKVALAHSGYSSEALSQAAEIVENKDENSEAYKQAKEILDQAQKNINEWISEVEAGEYDKEEVQKLLASSARNLDELQEMVDNNEITQEQYTEYEKSILQKELSYIKENIESIQELNNALAEGVISAQGYDVMYDSILQKELDAIDETKGSFETYKDIILESNEELSENSAITDQIVLSLLEEANALSDLSGKWDEYKKAIKKADKTSMEYVDSMGAVIDGLKDIFGVEVDADFVEKNMGDIDALMGGDASKMNELGVKAAQHWMNGFLQEGSVANQTLFQSFYDQSAALTSEGKMAEAQAQMEVFKQSMQDVYDSIGTLEIGASINDENFINGLQTMLDNGSMTTEQLQSYLGSIGLEWHGKTKPIEGQKTVTRSKTYIEGDEESESNATTMVTETVQDIQVPILTAESITKRGHTSTSTPSSNNSGGGSKSSGSKKTANKKNKKTKLDVANRNIKKLEDSINQLSEQQDKLFGVSAVDNLKNYNTQLQKQNDKYRDANKLLDARLKKQQKLSSSKTPQTLADYGVTFDKKSGEINYNSYSKAYEKYYKQYQKAIADYNKHKDDEETEKWENRVEKAEERLENLNELYDTYEENLDAQFDNYDAIIENIRTQAENDVAALELEIQYKVDASEAIKTLEDFKRSLNLEESYRRGWKYNLDQAETYNFGKNSSYLIDMQAQQKGLEQAQKDLQRIRAGKDGEVYHSEAEAIAAMGEYSQNLQNSVSDFWSAASEAIGEYISAYESVYEDMEEFASQYDDLIDKAEHYANVNNILAGEDDYDTQKKIANLKMNTYKGQVKAYEAMRVQAESDLAEAEAKLAEKGLSKADRALWLQRKELAEETMKEAAVNSQEAWENALTAAHDKFLTSLSKVFDDFNNKMLNQIAEDRGLEKGSLSLDYLESEWDLITQKSDIYLDDVNESLNLLKLQNKYTAEINKASSEGTQSRITDAMNEQLKILKEKDRLTQYDIDRANQRLNILIKEIALQEAQENKSKLRLRRDAQGNYSYQYTADQAAIDKAEEELADARAKQWNDDIKNLEDRTKDFTSIWSKFQEEYEKASQIADKTEREQQQAMLREQYKDILAWSADEVAQAEKYLREGSGVEEYAELQGLSKDFNSWTDKEKAEYEIWLESQVEALGSTSLDFVKTLKEYGLEAAIKKMDENVSKAEETYAEDIEILKGVKTGYDDIDASIKGINTELKETNKELNKNIKAWQNAIEEISTSASTAVNKINKAAEGDTVKTATKKAQSGAQKYIDENKNADKSTNKGTKKNPKPGDEVFLTGETYEKKKKGSKIKYKAGRYVDYPAIVISYDKNAAHPFKLREQSQTNHVLGWANKKAVKYDTGGYTGDWNSTDGKLAFLHKKELILNAKDTENMLTAINQLRTMDLSADASNALANLIDKYSSQVRDMVSNNNKEIQQKVSIEASFPNATNRTEIEAAFDSLINRASQYAWSDSLDV